MCQRLLFPLLFIVSSLVSANLQAENRAQPTPLELSNQLQDSLAKVRQSCVSVFAKGYGSGVIISEDGLILTAAHMMRHIKSPKDGSSFKITLDDGRKATAKLLGLNRETDYALLKITSPKETVWPHCQLAETASLTGDFCFTFAHPSGILKGRPAQVRLGRIFSHSSQREKPLYLFADCNIQPGDSGGPLFSMTGELIGLDSSAAAYLGLNIFPAIDQYHLDHQRLLNGERWGDPNKAPDGPAIQRINLNQESLEAIHKEFMRRASINYPPTVDLLQSLVNQQGEVKVDQQVMIKHMVRASMALSKKQPLSLGLDDPEIVKKLPSLPKKAAAAIPLEINGKRVGYALSVDSTHLLTKASLIPAGAKVVARINQKIFKLSDAASDPTWDLALLKTDTPTTLPAMKWPSPSPPTAAGSLLMARDHRGRLLWNVATDTSRIVAKKRSVGPLIDPSIISTHRAPYPEAVRHALPLTATDSGTPVFNQSGELAGMQIARFSRTMGLMIPVNILRQQTEFMLKEAKKTSELK